MKRMTRSVTDGSCSSRVPGQWKQYVMILLLVSLLVSFCLTMFLLYAFPFFFLHALPYCLYIATCAVCLLMHSPAQTAY